MKSTRIGIQTPESLSAPVLLIDNDTFVQLLIVPTLRLVRSENCSVIKQFGNCLSGPTLFGNFDVYIIYYVLAQHRDINSTLTKTITHNKITM